MSVGSVVAVFIAAVLLVSVVLLLRSRSPLPWPAIGVATVAAGIGLTVGSSSGTNTSDPNVATVMGAAAGLLAVIAAVVALSPKRGPVPEGVLLRLPILLSSAGVVIGASGLLIRQLVS